jgi:glyoxylase-like metal-dependent hydrolase (beta-lactamase superfamily II)
VRATGLWSARALLISGDILFAGSVGCPFFCGERLKLHLKRLLALSESTVVAPGHGPLTTIKNERTFNPFVV